MTDRGSRTEALADVDRFLSGKLRRVLFYRLVIAVSLLFLITLVQFRRGGDLFSSDLSPLYYFSCILFLFTIVAATSLRYLHCLRQFTYIQISFDVIAVTVLIYLSGGIDSPFTLLYMPVIISAAVLLRRKGSLLAASLCSVCYGILLDLQFFGWISPLQVVSEVTRLKDSGAYLYNIVMSVAGFYLVAYLSGYLAEELQKSSWQVSIHKRDFHYLEALHQNIVQSITSGLLTIGSGGHILFANTASLRLLERPKDQVEGHFLKKLFPSIDTAEWPHHAPPEGKMNTVSRKELIYTCPSGKELHLGYTASVLQMDDGSASGWVFIFQNLTQFKAMEQHVQRMERLAFAGKMAAEIAHEIKNPLAAMSGAVQMLQSELSVNSMHSRLMGIVDREIMRINDLVTDFLWLARGSKKSAKTQAVSVPLEMQEILSLLRTRNKIDASHSISSEIGTVPPIEIDPHHFRQIMWNLLTNALESMPDGGALSLKVCYQNGSSAGNGSVCIDVGDTGPGIPADLKPRIFEPFFTTKDRGTGLGLSIAYQLIETAGGRIEINSHEGAGTVFSVYFPSIIQSALAS